MRMGWDGEDDAGGGLPYFEKRQTKRKTGFLFDFANLAEQLVDIATRAVL